MRNARERGVVCVRARDDDALVVRLDAAEKLKPWALVCVAAGRRERRHHVQMRRRWVFGETLGRLAVASMFWRPLVGVNTT